MATIDTSAPVYRYITTDLLSNTVLAEIPFQGVSYGRGLSTAGQFSGNIPVIDGKTNAIDLYDATLPGRTGLYVMRDDRCVWGGIIWSRSYDILSKQLSVEGQEFTSYLHHRNIWKTFNSDFGVKVIAVSGDPYLTLNFDTGIFGEIAAGSKVQILFADASNAKFNGHYEVYQQVNSTQLRLHATVSGATITHTKYANKFVSVWTTVAHGFKVGDTVRMSVPGKSAAYQSSRVVTSVQHSTRFTYKVGGSDTKTYDRKKVTGSVSLARDFTPSTGAGYTATVRMRTDTYDYVRTLVQSVFNDFSGIEFATGQTPGVGYLVDVVNKQNTRGLTTITTLEPHELSETQQVQVKNVDPKLNGTWDVLEVPSATSFTYRNPGQTDVASTPVDDQILVVTKRVRSGLVVTLTTSTNHGLIVGNNVTVQNVDYSTVPTEQKAFDGYRTVASVPTATTFTYSVPSNAYTKVNTTTKTDASVLSTKPPATATVEWRPHIVVGTYGSFAGSADIGIKFEGQDTVSLPATLSGTSPESTCVVTTRTPHGLAVGRGVYFTTTPAGVLPSGIVAETVYYVASVPTPYTLTLVDSPGGSVIKTNNSLAQSGTHNLITAGIYSGVDVPPEVYRGGEVENLGEALDSYSENLSGFEYRIDCDYDPVSKSFTRTFKLLQIDVPNPPADGEVSPLSRFGADKLIFEHPGNISTLSVNESAENATTRFFVIGGTDGTDGNPYYAAATATDLLTPRDGSRPWPLLDDRESLSDERDQEVLYQKAEKYLRESKPPVMSLSVSVNGSVAPIVGTYAPGDWCAVITDDDFMRLRLQSGLEPRTTAIVRKIQAFSVSVPDGVAFPESVDLTLVAEWEIDTNA